MFYTTWTPLVYSLLLISSSGFVSEAASPVVSTSLGGIQGLDLLGFGVDAFLGIPYATVGERFSVSTIVEEPYTQPNGTPLNATQFSPWCHQPVDAWAFALPMAEECLSLNIWRPSNATNTPLTTMVWIHGGGFETGAGS